MKVTITGVQVLDRIGDDVLDQREMEIEFISVPKTSLHEKPKVIINFDGQPSCYIDSSDLFSAFRALFR